ncbi:phage holin family protein [Rosistilla oblonga]|uniref:phage holin family protein n=1 Tax=Rosistilla oblonga TaxID=2527990 RepID=UPI003A96A9EC
MNSPSGFGRVARDVLDLCELQMQLLSVDSQEAKRKATRAMVTAAAGITLGGSALTTAMVGGSFLLHEYAQWSVGASLLCVAGITFGIVAALLFAATKAITSASAALQETKSEFAENLKWLKAVLINPETSARNQLRAESFPDPNSSHRAEASTYERPVYNER